MNPNELKTYTFIDGDFIVDINVSLEEHNVYMKQTGIAKLLEIDKGTVSRFIRNFNENQMGQVAENGQICNNHVQPVAGFYDLEIIKEIGQKYNPERMQKLEEWLEQIIIENSQEVIDDNFEIVRYNQGKVPIMAMVDFTNKTAWLPQDSIALLFGVSIPTISEHITNILKEGELEERATLRNFRIVQIEGNRQIKRLVIHYNVQMLVAIGYRVKSDAAILFRKWVGETINGYIVDGRVYDESRIVALENSRNILFGKIIELENKVDDSNKKIEEINNKINNNDIPQEILFEQGDFYKAYEYLAKLVESSKVSIDIVDNYADYHLTSILKNKRKEVEVRVLTSPQAKLDDTAITSFNLEFGGLSIARNSTFHDRYIIIDKNISYHLGPSINHMGKKISQANKINESFVLDSVLKAIDDCFTTYIP